MVLSLSACTDEPNSTDSGGHIAPGGTSDSGSDDLESFDVNFDYSTLSESENIPTDESDTSYEDYVENSTFTVPVSITYNGSSASVIGLVDGVSAEVEGAHVTLTSTIKNVEVSVSGSTPDGSLKVYSDYKYLLSLNAADITNASGAAINNQGKKRLFVKLSGENSLSDAESYSNVPEDEDLKGCLFSEGQIVFSGNGSLTVNANYKHGIASDDYIMFRPGNVINVSTTNGHCIKGKDAVIIKGGVLNLATSGTADKGISTDGDLTINGGRTTCVTTGNAEYDEEEQDTSSPSGAKVDGNYYQSGGTLAVKSSGKGGKGVNVDGTMVIDDGTISVLTTGPRFVYTSDIDAKSKGIKADGNLTMNGGKIKIRTSGGEGSEGLESKSVMTINGGTIEIVAYDDAINAASGIAINGGYIYAYATNNDAIDSNGTIAISGGTTIAIGAGAPEGSFDCDNNQFKITGGTIIGLGGDISTPTANVCTQPSIISGNSISAGSSMALTKSDGSVILTFKVQRSFSTMLISSPSLSTGSSYNLVTGGSASGGTTFHGLSTGGSYSGGSQVASINVTSMVTTSNANTGGMPGGGGVPGGGGMPW